VEQEVDEEAVFIDVVVVLSPMAGQGMTRPPFCSHLIAQGLRHFGHIPVHKGFPGEKDPVRHPKTSSESRATEVPLVTSSVDLLLCLTDEKRPLNMVHRVVDGQAGQEVFRASALGAVTVQRLNEETRK
jgi:hypothetical protein